MKLTIAIPTYNRPEIVLNTVSKLLSFPNSSQVKLLVVDNGSEVNINQYFKNILQENSNLTVKRFETNDGFYESFFRLFDHCETEFMMTLSDEDCFDLSSLSTILKILELDNPNLLRISSRDKLNKLFKFKKKRINLYNLRSETGYISGLIFKTKPVNENISFFRQLSKFEDFAFLYPTVIVAFALALSGKCLRLTNAALTLGPATPTLIKSIRGSADGAYPYPTERVFQYLSLLRCFGEMQVHFPKYSYKISTLEFFAKINFFGLIFDSVGNMSAEAQSHLIFSSVKTFINYPFRKMRTFLR
jgi:glycosyltransferase involved in cell wall biosynthesis